MTKTSYSDALAAFEAQNYNTCFEILGGLMQADGIEDTRLLPLLAESFMRVGMYKEAAETFEQAFEQGTEEAPVHLLKTLALYEHIGDADKSFLTAMMLQKIVPDHPDVVYSLIRGLQRSGELELIGHFQNKLVHSNIIEHLRLAVDLIGDDHNNENNLVLFQKLREGFPDNQFYRFALLGFARQFSALETLKQEEDLLDIDLADGHTEILKFETPGNVLLWCGNEAMNRLALNARNMPALPAGLSAERRSEPHIWGPKLRVGYVSDAFWDGSTTMRMLQSVLLAQDAEKFETTLFCFTPEAAIAQDSGNRAKWGKIIPVGDLSDEDAAAAIRAENIDILVDLKGYSPGCRPGIFNLKAAPVQVSWFGFSGSAVNIDCDYVIGDRFVTPDSSAPYYHEKFVRLPDSYQPNDPEFRAKPAMALRFLFGLPANKFVFASFHSARKINTRIFDLWLEILRRAENAVLWLMIDSERARTDITAYASARGIEADRIIFANSTEYSRHITRISAADLALDTLPCNGHSTTSDSLWAGLPVLTAKGSNFASRVSESLLNAVGLPDLVAATPQDYVDKAVSLAGDAAQITAYKTHLKDGRATSPLFDAKRFARHLDKAFAMMAERAKAGLAPDHIDVPVID